MARTYPREAYESVVTATGTLEGVRVSWGGVWSGFLIGMGILLLFSALGLAIGISAAGSDPGGGLNARGLGIGAAIWGGLSLLAALFVGGIVATRVGMVFDRTVALIQGALIWVLATLAIIYLAGSGIGLVASGAFGLLSGLTGGVGAVVSSVPRLDDLASGDVNQILARLRDPETVRMVAAATGMSEQEARSTLANIQTRVEAVRDDPAKAMAEARQGLQEVLARAGKQVAGAAAAAQPYASGALWMTLAAMVLSLLAAIAGAMIGRYRAAARLVQ
jgi:hypothetical protein